MLCVDMSLSRCPTLQTEHAEESFETVKDVIKEAGGELAKLTKAKEKQLLSSDQAWYLISCERDKKIWEPVSTQRFRHGSS